MSTDGDVSDHGPADEASPFLSGGEVRPATGSDAETLARLERTARAGLVDARGGRSLLAEQPAVDDWLAALARPSTLVWVAAIDGVVVGFLELRHTEGDEIGVVRQVYVDEDARELGFGDVLLAAAIEAIRARGGACVESFALPGDRDTKNLFERAGVTARKIIVSKRLD